MIIIAFNGMCQICLWSCVKNFNDRRTISGSHASMWQPSQVAKLLPVFEWKFDVDLSMFMPLIVIYENGDTADVQPYAAPRKKRFSIISQECFTEKLFDSKQRKFFLLNSSICNFFLLCFSLKMIHSPLTGKIWQSEGLNPLLIFLAGSVPSLLLFVF